MKNDLKHFGAIAGIGLAAGMIGTLVMSLGQRIEIAATKRPPSDTPAKAVETIGGAQPPARYEPPLATAAHLAFGTSLGLGLAALDKVPEPARGLLFFAGAWTTGTALITGLGLSDPPTKWDAGKLAIDLGHHAVYAASAAAAFFGLRRLAGR